ncbi:glycoside hydrolase family 3 protein [Thalassotalea sp. PP2-459]|uniref:glycoside hydrolase family 3 protein n=1 Tax=Thalassotalea sp. PP2-459 TaxID=1742724 RepID=UPI00094382C8|nr:glycoside hydrolase family 3 N-terminal domain-containing protein [Thalassotalea sp. PP2-459]OKY27373.1 beta-glucosidase [Thalassotalea sp. PP2-459]
MDFTHKVNTLIASLSLPEKVGQLFVLAFAGEDIDYAKSLVRDYHIGGFYITDDNAKTSQAASTLAQTLQTQASLRACDAPLILAVDQEGAWGILTNETDLGPGNLALGIANDTQLTQNMYQVFAEQMQTIGYNTLLSPCADVNANPDNPIIGQRAFGEQAEHVALHVKAAVEGVQKSSNVACAKHFPGHGDTKTDSHRSLPTVDKSLAELTQQDLLPFSHAINAGVAMIMTSHICYPQLDAENPATLSYPILTTLLKEQMGFDGLIITDSMNMWAMRKNYQPEHAAVQALNAGAHLIMLSEEHYENQETPYKEIQQQTIQGVIDAVQQQKLPLSVIDNALAKVLCMRYQKLQQPVNHTQFSKKRCQEIAQQSCSQSIKLLRNHANWLPLNGRHFYLTFAANEQCYESLVNSRGIGPNDPVPARQALISELTTLGANYTLVPLEQLNEDHPAFTSDDPIIITTEDYPLPGESFDTDEQQQKVIGLLNLFQQRLIVIACRSDYELKHFPSLQTYLCSYSSRALSARALAQYLIKKV